MNVKHLLVCVCIVFSKLAVAGNLHNVECAKKIPHDLSAKLAETQAGLSIPSTNQLDPASIEYDKKSGGDGCYVVAKGVFDDDHRYAFAIVLAEKNGHPALVVASRQTEGWMVQPLPTFCEDIKFCYVKRKDPGTYVRSSALEATTLRGSEREEITSEHDVIVSGRLESTEVTYVNKSGKWLYVWTSD